MAERRPARPPRRRRSAAGQRRPRPTAAARSAAAIGWIAPAAGARCRPRWRRRRCAGGTRRTAWRARSSTGSAGAPDQLLLRDLGPEVAAVGQPVGADDRQGDVVPDAGRGLGVQQVARGGLEELEHRGVLERGRVRDVDDRRGAGQRLGQALAGDRVDARGRRGGHRLVAVLAQAGDDLRADSPVPPMTTIFMMVFLSCRSEGLGAVGHMRACRCQRAAV